MRKSSPLNAIDKFDGKAGTKRLIEVIKSQVIVNGEINVAKKIFKKGQLKEFKKGQHIIEQDDHDTDIYFIICGSVSIRVNEREVALRYSGNHFGEMSLIEPTKKRSATVVATEPTVVLKISEYDFTKTAGSFPEMWRKIAIELSNRLRERNRFIKTPNRVPIVFIGSSSEGIKVAQRINTSMQKSFIAKIWTDDVFTASKTSIESLMDQLEESDFSILIFTPDDTTISRGKRQPAPRDNIILELGLFIGSLSRTRTFVLKPKGVDIKIPSDLLGVTVIEYDRGGNKSLNSRLKPVCNKLTKIINKTGPK